MNQSISEQVRPPFPDKMTFREMIENLFNVTFITPDELNTLSEAGEMYANACIRLAGASFRESLAGKGFRWSKHPDQNDSNLKEGDTLLFIRDNGSGEVVTFTHHAGYGLGVIDSHGEKAIVSVSRCTRIIIESPMKSEGAGWVRVEDGLPDYDENVLVFYTIPHKNGVYKYFTIAHLQNTTTGKTYKHADWVTDEWDPVKPTHWHPLPPAPLTEK